ncbi:MAG: 4-alpha-glucanotransferase [Desulfovibrio sp.]|jgi:4-alpha-glucanotransferase|nr:4-alpha-glucanotransferase [Desulfovibrio sp.]
MRRYGLLLHISSLPSACGIGDMGPAAHAFVNTLEEIGAAIWQFLPLHPTSVFIGNSPYSSPSAFAGNPLLISPEYLVRDGYISYADMESACLSGESLFSDANHVDFSLVTTQRSYLLYAAYERNCHRLQDLEDFQVFCREHAYWLHDYARFISLKEEYGGISWVEWPQDMRLHDPQALQSYDVHASHAIMREKFIQYLFFSQWRSLRGACNKAGISLLADVPIYVTHDSVDVWANPHFFHLDGDMLPTVVSGVPPDYFSETGQLWGTPLYNWEYLAKDDFSWWKRRLGHILLMADMARLDHFRGFCAYWEVPAGEKTAVNGKWRKAPAREFFAALSRHFGGLPFIAEDLGIITDDVRRIMREFSLPGMHVLQFAFGGDAPAANPDIPHNHNVSSVVYTGTHDNIPTRSWFTHASQQEQMNMAQYVGQHVDEETVSAVLARAAFASVAQYAVLPVQDALNLGEDARMNTPGVASGNWNWRLTPDALRADRFIWLKEYARIYGRLPDGTPPESS